MTLATARQLATHGAAAVAFLALVQGSAYPLWVELLFAGLLAVSWLKGERFPGWLGWPMTVLTGGLGLLLIFLSFRTSLDGVVASGGFCAALALNRLLSRRSPADDLAIYLTAFLMLTVGAVLTGDVAYAAWFIAFAVALTVGMTLSHLDREAAQARLGDHVRRELLTWPLLRALLALALAALAMVGVFFVIFPRVNGGWLGRRGGLTPSPMIGFNSTVELGGQGVLRDDPRPALRIQLPDLQRRAEEKGTGLPRRLDYLFRGEALDTFDGKRWSVAPQETHYVRNAAPHAFDGIHAEIEVLPVSDAALVFSPGLALAAHVFQNQVGTALHLKGRAGGDISIEPRPPGPYRVETWSGAEPNPAALLHRGTDYPADVRTRDLQLPTPLDPRISALARSWTKGLTDPAAQVEAVKQHLHQDFAYTLELPGETPDPLAHFLFERKAGHCEFFSTAMVILLRTLGIPARQVMGFAGAVLAPTGDYFLSRAGDAHSWVEVYFPGLGYVTVDPTPLSYRDAEPDSLGAYLSAALDAVERRWEASVVDYNLSSQIALVSQAAAALHRALNRNTSRGPTPIPWRAVLEVLAVLALFALLWARRGRLRLGRSAAPVSAPSRAYQVLLRALQRRGLDRRADETPREFALRVEQLRRVESPHLWEMTRLHEQARYGRREWTSADERRARDLVRTLPHEGGRA